MIECFFFSDPDVLLHASSCSFSIFVMAGEEFDEEEQKIVSGVNNAILKKLPYSVDMIPAEEQLMLLGHASTAEEASLILTGGRERTIVPQLYSAPDPEEDERAARAIEEMADLMLQLQESVAAGSTDPSVLQVINESTAFFEFGVQPKRGLDAVDKLLMRKKTLMDHCGNRSDHWANREGVSKQMLCAVRIHMLNESDLDVVCPETSGAFWLFDGADKRCEGGGFNWTNPISEENENATIKAIKQTLVSLLSGFPSSREDDIAMLEEEVDNSHVDGMGPIRRNAILVRARERRILKERYRVFGPQGPHKDQVVFLLIPAFLFVSFLFFFLFFFPQHRPVGPFFEPFERFELSNYQSQGTRKGTKKIDSRKGRF